MVNLPVSAGSGRDGGRARAAQPLVGAECACYVRSVFGDEAGQRDRDVDRRTAIPRVPADAP